MGAGSIEWAVEMLRSARSVDEVRVILRGSARASVQAQGATVVQLENGQCYYADEDAMSPLWKGQRFPVSQCISGWAMLHRETVVVPNVFADDRIPQAAYRPTFVRSLVVVPIGVADPVGAIGVYWSNRHIATLTEVSTLEHLAAAAATALARIRSLTPAPVG